MQDQIGSSVLDAMRLLLRDRLNNERAIVDGLHFFCEVLEQPHKFQEVYDLLADDDSKRTLTWLIKYRVACFMLQSKDAASDLIWGPAEHLAIGYASDPDVRYRGSTGGVLTALGQYLLESGRAKFILHVVRIKNRLSGGPTGFGKVAQDGIYLTLCHRLRLFP